MWEITKKREKEDDTFNWSQNMKLVPKFDEEN